jgi:hypothetical protein
MLDKPVTQQEREDKFPWLPVQAGKNSFLRSERTANSSVHLPHPVFVKFVSEPNRDIAFGIFFFTV